MGYVKDLEHFTLVRNVGMRYYFPDIIRAGELYVMSFREAPERIYTKHIDAASYPAILVGKDPLHFDVDTRHIVTCALGGGALPCLSLLSNGSLVLTDMLWVSTPECGGQMFDFHDMSWPAIYGGSYMVPLEISGGEARHGKMRKIGIPEFPEIGIVGSMIPVGGDEYLIAADVDEGCFDKRGTEGFNLVLRTPDSGESWELRGVISRESERRQPVIFAEPYLKMLPGGRMLAFLRSMDVPNNDFVYRAESDDMGKTWSEALPLELRGHPPYVLELSDGRMLLFYGKRFPPVRGIAVCISEDDGRTWDPKDEVMLRTDGENSDLGYPRAVVMDDGSVLVVYYMTHEFKTPFGKKEPITGNCPVCDDDIVLHVCDKYMVRSICASRFFVE